MIARLLPALPISTASKVFIAFILAAVCAYLATPRLSAISNEPNLESTVPHQFGDWRELSNPYAQVSLATGPEAALNQPYDQTLMRTYVNTKGQQVMLALAWGRHQRQEIKVHRPDLCYVAQGYKIKSLTKTDFENISIPFGKVSGKRMLASTNNATEAVSYWIRIGNLYSEDAFDTRLHILKEGFKGNIPDGILVRASMQINDPKDAESVWPILDAFLTALTNAVPPETKNLLVR